MHINVTEFRNDISMYLELARTQDIIITRHGEFIARVSGTKKEKYRMLDEISGIVDYKGNPEDIFEKRLDEL